MQGADAPLIEDAEVAATAATSSAGSASAGQRAGSAPSVTLTMGDGAQVTLGAETLQMVMLAVQTVLLVYVTYKEVA